MPRVYAMMVRQGLHHLIQGLCSLFRCIQKTTTTTNKKQKTKKE